MDSSVEDQSRNVSGGKEDQLSSDNEWQWTFDALPDLIAIIDNNHRLRKVNKAMALKFGLAPEEMIGRFCYRFFHLGEQPSFCPHHSVITTGCATTFEAHETALGGPYLITMAPVKDETGRIVGCLHIARDISEQRKAEAEIRKLNKELSDHVRARTEELRQSESRRMQLEEEIQRLEYCIPPVKTPLAAWDFGISPLRDGRPKVFADLLCRFQDVLDSAVEESTYQVGAGAMGAVHELAEDLGAMRSTARDVIDIYTEALKQGKSRKKKGPEQAYIAEGRILVLKLMGDLLTYYRRHVATFSPVAGRLPPAPTSAGLPEKERGV